MPPKLTKLKTISLLLALTLLINPFTNYISARAADPDDPTLHSIEDIATAGTTETDGELQDIEPPIATAGIPEPPPQQPIQPRDMTRAAPIYAYNSTILSSQTYTVTQSGKYRFHVVGKGGNGGAGATSGSGGGDGRYSGGQGAGGASGSTGAYAIHDVALLAGQVVNITVTDTQTKIALPSGAQIYANAGVAGGAGISVINNNSPGIPASVAGVLAGGGNVANYSGVAGYGGSTGKIFFNNWIFFDNGASAPTMSKGSEYPRYVPVGGAQNSNAISDAQNLGGAGAGGQGFGSVQHTPSSGKPDWYYSGSNGGTGGAGGVVFEIAPNNAPTTTGAITVPTSVNRWQQSTYNISWGVATDPDGDTINYVLEYAVNGSGSFTYLTTTTSPSYTFTIPASNPNNVQFRVKAVDTFSAESGYVTSNWTSIVYNSPPTTPTGMTNPASVNSWQATSVAFGCNASTDVNGDTINYIWEIAVNGGAWTSVQNSTLRSYTRNIVKPTDEYYQVRVCAFDGIVYSGYLTSGIVTITHDTVKPTIQVVCTPQATTTWAKDSVTITVIVSDALSLLKDLIVPPDVTPTGNKTLTGSSATITYTASKNKTYSFTVTDNAGNSASASTSPSKIDDVFPTITYTTNPPNGQFTNGDVVVNLTLSDAPAGLASYLSLNGTESISGSSTTKAFTATSNGVLPFSVTDIVGHNTAINVTVNMIDKVKPLISALPSISSYNNQSSINLQATMTDDYAGIKTLTLPNGSVVSPSSGVNTINAAHTYSITANGTYTFKTTDRATNTSNAFNVVYNSFDRTKPKIETLKFNKTSNPLKLFKSFGNIVSNKSIAMEITYSDTPTGTESESGVEFVRYRVYNKAGVAQGDWVQVKSNQQIPSIESEVDGYVDVQVIDRANNYSDISKYEILLDDTAPEISYTLSETGITNKSVNVVFFGTDNAGGSGWKEFILPNGDVRVPVSQFTWTFTSNGSITIKGIDNAGNEKSMTATVSNIEKVPPVMNEIKITPIGSTKEYNGIGFDQQVNVEFVATDDVKIKSILYAFVSDSADENEPIDWQLVGSDGIASKFPEFKGYVYAKAVDFANNESSTLKRRLILDGVKPVIEKITFKQQDNGEAVVSDGITIYKNNTSISVKASDNIELWQTLYAITSTSDLPLDASQWHIMDAKTNESGIFELIIDAEHNLSYLHIKTIDMAKNEADTQTFAFILDKADPIIENITIERAGNAATDFINTLFSVFNSGIRIGVKASDTLKLKSLKYSITPDTDIPVDTTWLDVKDNEVIVGEAITGVIHFIATDMAGRKSKIESRRILIDTSIPQIFVSEKERPNEFAPVVMLISAKDDASGAGVSGIASIILPDGTIVHDDNSEFAVTENGFYTFKTIDSAGNETALEYTVDKIEYITESDWQDNKVVIDAVLHATAKAKISDVTYADLQRIKYIDLSSNGMTAIPEVFAYLLNLEHLDLRGNEFETVPACIEELTKLKYLDLSNNNLSEINIDISKLTVLEFFDVSLNYLIDYELPIIIANFRSVGNFTNIGLPEQYTFKLIEPVAKKEYIGNSTQFTVEWTYNGQKVSSSLETHRKALFAQLYPAYHTYRPMLYKYTVQNGQINKATADYAQVYLPQIGVVLINIEMGKV